MDGHSRLRARRFGQRGLALCLLAPSLCSLARAQVPIPTPEPFAPGVSSASAVQSAPAPVLSTPMPPPTAREAQLEDRVRQLEALVNQLSTQMRVMAATSSTPPPAPAAGAPGGGPDVGNRATATAPSQTGGPAAPGQSLPPNPPPSARWDSPATLENRPGAFKFGPGFELRSNDDEFILQFHDLTQFDYRGYEQAGQTPVHNTFTLPRQWFMFSGRLGKPFGYFLSLASGFDTLNILDIFLDVELDPRLRFRLGRFKSPFTYEFFVEPIQGLVIPERSMFFNNFGLNRDLGVMAFGRLFNQSFDYAAMLSNGTRNGFLDADNSKDVSGLINWRPFSFAKDSLIENFSIGGSFYAGNQNHVPVVSTFRTVVPIAGNAVIGVPFLALNSNVREDGFRAFWDLHAAWFYKGWAVVGEWQSGFSDYTISPPGIAGRVHLPVDSFYVQASYLLTGETRSSFGVVKPLRPFNLVRGQMGPGAIEPFARYESLQLGNDIFTRGLADQNLWTNSASAVWAGFNWHWTQYIKCYFGWNHVMFGQPVIFAPGRRQLTSDLFVARIQIYF